MKKIAIVNRTNLKNFGSVLQVFALCFIVEKLGYNSEVVWVSGNISKNFDMRPNKIFYMIYKSLIYPDFFRQLLLIMKTINNTTTTNNKVVSFDLFVNKFIKRKFYSNNELKKIAKTDEYYKFICGSDQIWCSTLIYVDPIMYLRFAPKEKRIAYAPSLGRDFIPKYNEKQIIKYINDIPYISIREQIGKELIEKSINKEVSLVCDPTLLLDKEEWKQLVTDNVIIDNKFILTYFLEKPTKKNQLLLLKFAKNNNLKIINIGVELIYIQNSELYSNLYIGPSEFISYIDKSELIVTDSYHGMLFAIIFNKNFWSLERYYEVYDQSSRQKSILNTLGINNRYILSCENLNLDNVNYSNLNEKLQKFKEKSLEYLKNALEG